MYKVLSLFFFFWSSEITIYLLVETIPKISALKYEIT